jgi:hypothetical protein
MVWQWTAGAVLAGLSFLWPRAIESGWALPFWTVTQTPIAVVALLLVFYYEVYYQTTFAARAGAGSS